MKQTILFKGAVCVFFSGLLLAMNYVMVTVYTAYRIGMTPVVIAARDIPPRTVLTEDDLLETEIPKGYILSRTVTDADGLVGKITGIAGMIPAGSPFYETMVEEVTDIPDRSAALLNEGQTVYRIIADPAELASFTAGMHADVYAVIPRKTETPLSGCLIDSARILTIRDHQGAVLSGREGDGIPYLAEIAIQREDIGLLTQGEAQGELKLFPSRDPYDGKKEASRCAGSGALSYLAEGEGGH